ncbi:MAG: ammonia channel protein, partial [Actinobacteria bacterium]|nr:ammonia channel protein [Actinomycetota bacterium]
AQLGTQAIGVLATVAFAGIATFVILKLVGVVTALRATPEEEELGLDLSLHGEDAYPDIMSGSLTGRSYGM